MKHTKNLIKIRDFIQYGNLSEEQAKKVITLIQPMMDKKNADSVKLNKRLFPNTTQVIA